MSALGDPLRMLSAKPRRARRPLAAAATSGKTPSSLVTWDLGLTHHWMGNNPRVKTRILLGTHEWIIDRVLAPDVGLDALAADLRPDEGALTRALVALVPPDDVPEWRHFIDLVVANLRHALLVPVTRHNEAWVRWLFLIPYSIRQTAEGMPAPTAPASTPPETRQDAATNGSATVTDRAPVWQVARV
jgi:hypothetical protein